MGARIVKVGGHNRPKKMLIVTFGKPSKYNYDRNFAVKHADGVAQRILGRHFTRLWSDNTEAAYTLTTKDKRRNKQGWI